MHIFFLKVLFLLVYRYFVNQTQSNYTYRDKFNYPEVCRCFTYRKHLRLHEDDAIKYLLVNLKVFKTTLSLNFRVNNGC